MLNNLVIPALTVEIGEWVFLKLFVFYTFNVSRSSSYARFSLRKSEAKPFLLRFLLSSLLVVEKPPSLEGSEVVGEILLLIILASSCEHGTGYESFEACVVVFGITSCLLSDFFWKYHILRV